MFVAFKKYKFGIYAFNLSNIPKIMKKALFHLAILPDFSSCFANDVDDEINSHSNQSRLKLIKLKLLVVSMLIFISAKGQTIYTPYDELPNYNTPRF